MTEKRISWEEHLRLKMEYLQVTSSNKKTIFELFNKDTDSNGFIIEKESGKRIICKITREIFI